MFSDKHHICRDLIPILLITTTGQPSTSRFTVAGDDRPYAVFMATEQQCVLYGLTSVDGVAKDTYCGTPGQENVIITSIN